MDLNALEKNVTLLSTPYCDFSVSDEEGNAFINAGLPAFTGSYADWAQTLIYLCEMTFTIAKTVGSVKGAQTLTSKAAYISIASVVVGGGSGCGCL